jgi:hypothetical protein
MYDLRISLPLTQDERASVVALLLLLERDKYLKNKLDRCVLMPLLQRIIDKSMSAVMINPFNHTEYDEYDFARDLEKIFSKYTETKL